MSTGGGGNGNDALAARLQALREQKRQQEQQEMNAGADGAQASIAPTSGARNWDDGYDEAELEDLEAMLAADAALRGDGEQEYRDEDGA